MLVISSREFRENQKSYLDKIDEGIEILVRRGKNKSYKIVAISDDDTVMSKEAFAAKISNSLEQYTHGEFQTKRPDEPIDQFLERISSEIHD